MERREFLHVFGAALGAALLARPLAAAAAACTTRALVLDAAECELLEAICARILPPVGGVSTREAGCVNFIDKLLAHEEQALAPAYRVGLAALDALARGRLARGFAALDAAQQVSLLEQLEDGNTGALAGGGRRPGRAVRHAAPAHAARLPRRTGLRRQPRRRRLEGGGARRATCTAPAASATSR